MARILVTGAAGFIGGAVIAECRRRGVRATGLDRSGHPPYEAPLRAEPVVDHVVDLVDADLDPLLAGVDAVIHLAGTPGVQSSWSTGFDHHVRNNLVATQRLCEAALRCGVGRVIVASSSSVYGNVPSGSVAESSPLQPISPYGASKAAMELLAGSYVERGLSVTPLRYFTVYGPWQRPDMAIHRMIRAALGGPAFGQRGDGTRSRSFTYVDDVATATVDAAFADLPSGAPVNIGGTHIATVRELVDRVSELTGRPVPVEVLPPAPGDPDRTSADIGRAERWLGWTPRTGLDDGLGRQWAWHLEHPAASRCQVAAVAAGSRAPSLSGAHDRSPSSGG